MITHRHPEFGELITQPRVWQTDSGTWYVSGHWQLGSYIVFANLPLADVNVGVAA